MEQGQPLATATHHDWVQLRGGPRQKINTSTCPLGRILMGWGRHSPPAGGCPQTQEGPRKCEGEGGEPCLPGTPGP